MTKNHANYLNNHRIEPRDHLVKFFDTKEVLTETVCDYVVPGLSRGDGIIIIAIAAHRETFEYALENRAIDVSKVKAGAQLILLDASETLSTFMVNGMPDKAKFNSILGTKIKYMLQKFPHIRAYGEMVNLLWSQKNYEAAIELENLWNNLANELPFALLCSYSMDESLKKNGKGLNDICYAHTHKIAIDGVMTKTNTTKALSLAVTVS